MRCRITQLKFSILILMLAGAVTASARETKPPVRLRVTVLGFTNGTGDPEAAHWSYGIERLLSSELTEIK